MNKIFILQSIIKMKRISHAVFLGWQEIKEYVVFSNMAFSEISVTEEFRGSRTTLLKACSTFMLYGFIFQYTECNCEEVWEQLLKEDEVMLTYYSIWKRSMPKKLIKKNSKMVVRWAMCLQTTMMSPSIIPGQ